jgi:hypothetical protein
MWLYIIAERFCREILETKRVRTITRVKLGRDLIPNHIFFIDNLLLLIIGYPREDKKKLKEILEFYY